MTDIMNYDVEKLSNEVYCELSNLGYGVEISEVENAIELFLTNKADIISKMEKHPYYNGNFQIIFPENYTREINTDVCDDFIYWCSNLLENNDDSYNFRRAFLGLKNSTITQERLEIINYYIKDTGITVGMKTSRAVRKVCVKYKLDKHENFDNVIKKVDENGLTHIVARAKFPTFADAINPLTVQKWTSISVHPLDFLFMSHGSGWASCHMIDKYGYGNWNTENNYSGCYSGGTMSYMLDGSSVVFYTVDSSYNGNKLYLEPKIQRNMFHLSEDRIIQGRVYPQGNDGGTDIYREFRNVMQKVWADCIDKPNYWHNIKGTDVCADNVESEGVHYRDYTHYGDCNVSFLKEIPEEKRNSLPRIRVGHIGYCMCCGHNSYNEENILCEDCADDTKKCVCCGGRYDEEDMYVIGDEYYCSDCSSYCECCDERVAQYYDDMHRVHGMGRVCDDCYEQNERISTCEYCDRAFDNYNYGNLTEDGHSYCDDVCCEDAGYTYIYGKSVWVRSSEICECQKCNEQIRTSDMSERMADFCRWCAEELESEVV